MKLDPYTIGETDVILMAHPLAACFGEYCCLHNPSDHHMRTWPRHWREDRSMMERVCPCHGDGHPDPDDLASIWVTHACEGCCTPPVTP